MGCCEGHGKGRESPPLARQLRSCGRHGRHGRTSEDCPHPTCSPSRARACPYNSLLFGGVEVKAEAARLIASARHNRDEEGSCM